MTSRNRKHTKLTPVGRLISLILILTLGAIAGAAGAAATRPHAQAWRCISVRPGETLWGIAAHNPAADRRQTVQRIIDENHLASVADTGPAIWVPNEGDVRSLMRAPASSCPSVAD